MREALELAIKDIHNILNKWKTQGPHIDYVQLSGAMKTVILKRVEAYIRNRDKINYWRAHIRSTPMIILDTNRRIISIEFPSYDTNSITREINTIFKQIELNPVMIEDHIIDLDLTKITNIRF